MIDRSPETGNLDELIEQARGLTGEARYALREPLAGFGLEALPKVAPWMTSPDVPAPLRWFAVRVVSQIGLSYRKEASAALRRAAERSPDEATRTDAVAALASLRATH